MALAVLSINLEPACLIDPIRYSFLPADRPVSLKPPVSSSSVVFFFHVTTSDIIFTDAAVTIRGFNHYSISGWLHEILIRYIFFIFIVLTSPCQSNYINYHYTIFFPIFSPKMRSQRPQSSRASDSRSMSSELMNAYSPGQRPRPTTSELAGIWQLATKL